VKVEQSEEKRNKKDELGENIVDQILIDYGASAHAYQKMVKR
jgi:hypothetical protein